MFNSQITDSLNNGDINMPGMFLQHGDTDPGPPDQHIHRFAVDSLGMGSTDAEAGHVHLISNGVVLEANGHVHNPVINKVDLDELLFG